MKRALSSLVAVTTVAVSITACKSLLVLPMPTGQIEGIAYALPQKTFIISAQYELRGCSYDEASGKPILSVKTTVNVVPTVEVDPSARYYIPYASLHGAFKDIDLTVQSYDNGTLKGLDLTQTDKTGETITAAIGVAARVATIAAGAAALEAAKPKPTACQDDVIKALDRVKALEVQIAALSKKDDAKAEKPDAPASAASGAAAKATKKGGAAVAAAKAPAAPASAASAPTISDERLVDDLTMEMQRLRSSKLIFKEVHYWTPVRPSDGDPQRRFSVLVYPNFDLKTAWMTGQAFGGIAESDLVEVDGKKFIKSMLMQVALDTLLPVAPGKAASAPEGLVLRQPVRALLRTCEVACPPGFAGDVRSVVKSEDVDVPQLGQTIVMPLKNGLFQSKTLSIAMSEDGAITKAGIKSSATAPAALGSLNADLDVVMKAKAARDKAKADAREAALNENKDKANQVAADNKAVADCINAQKALAALGGTVTGTCQ